MVLSQIILFSVVALGVMIYSYRENSIKCPSACIFTVFSHKWISGRVSDSFSNFTYAPHLELVHPQFTFFMNYPFYCVHRNESPEGWRVMAAPSQESAGNGCHWWNGRGRTHRFCTLHLIMKYLPGAVAQDLVFG